MKDIFYAAVGVVIVGLGFCEDGLGRVSSALAMCIYYSVQSSGTKFIKGTSEGVSRMNKPNKTSDIKLGTSP